MVSKLQHLVAPGVVDLPVRAVGAYGVEVSVVCAVELVVEAEQVLVGTSRQLLPLVLVAEVGCERCAVEPLVGGCKHVPRCGCHIVDAERQVVGVCNLGIGDVHLDHAEGGTHKHILALHGEQVHRLALGERLVVIVGQVYDGAVGTDEVDVAVVIEHHQPFRRRAPSYVRNATVAQSGCLVIGLHLAVGGVVRKQTSRREHIDLAVCRLDLCNGRIRQHVLPRPDGCGASLLRGQRHGSQDQKQ